MKIVRTTMIAAAVLAWTGGFAADAPKKDADASAKSQYEAERARCMSGTTGQDQASCLKSAGAAYDSMRQNRHQDGVDANYRDNASTRCAALPQADRADCLSRVGGGGTSEGSVQGGGIIKETVTKTGPAVPPAK